MKYINDIWTRLTESKVLVAVLVQGLKVVSILAVCIIAYLITTKVVLKLLSMYINKTKSSWDDAFLKRKVFTKLARLVPAIIIYVSAPIIPEIRVVIERTALSFIYLNVAFVISSVLDAANDIYMTFPVSKARPIKGFLQIVKIVVYIIMGVLIISVILDKSPWILLSSIGALTAITTLVFKDSIMGFVAGVQLTTNDMLRIGDWIEMPKYGADGDVIEITLNTVKVKNWDKTITTIPAYALVSDSFKNWRGMHETGGRRIKRAIYIDVTSIKFCTPEMLEKFKKIHLLTEYIENKEKEIAEYNKEHNIDTSLLVNGRHLTNIGTFRKYIEYYLENHPRVHKGLIRMVRQLSPDDRGLPLEIYAFVDNTQWVTYENVQADIFDHIFAVVDTFELRIFQKPSGNDMQLLGSSLKES